MVDRPVATTWAAFLETVHADGIPVDELRLDVAIDPFTPLTIWRVRGSDDQQRLADLPMIQLPADWQLTLTGMRDLIRWHVSASDAFGVGVTL